MVYAAARETSGVILTRGARLMPVIDPGRNDPCACGSGRKYKHCCLQALEAESARRARLRAAEGRVVPALFAYATQRWGKSFFAEAWEEFFVWDQVPEDVGESPEFGTLFVPWFVFSFVSDPTTPDRALGIPDKPVGLAYLEEGATSLPDLDRLLIEIASRTPFGFHAVQSVTPGRDMSLREILTGHECRVLEQSASTLVKRGAILYGQAVTVLDASIMLACSPIEIPPAWHNHIIDFRQEIWRKRTPTIEQLGAHDLEVRELYLYIADMIYNPPPPQIQNTDGDPLLPTTLAFELRCSVMTAYGRLKPLTLSAEANTLSDAGRTPEGELTSVRLDWHKRGNRAHQHWDNTVLGTLTIESGRMTASVNSKRRADRLRREVAKRLGADVVFVGSRTEPIEPLLQRAAQQARSDQSVEEQELEQDPDVQRVLGEMMARHWEAWLDERVPALANRTPRQAGKTTLGRERLEALFADFAWRAENMPPHLKVDIPGLRRKLGL